MSDRVFLDTNIFVYAIDDSAGPKSVTADRLIAEGLGTQNAVVSYQVVQEFLNVVVTKFSKPMATEQAARYMTTVFRGLHMIHSSLGLFSDAMDVRARYRVSWYDSLILAAAAMAGCIKLYTEDLQDGALIAGVRIENPFRLVT
jgi:predicted nucleic acid-binding protein